MDYINYQYINLQSIKEETFGDTDILKEIMVLFIDLIDEYTQILCDELPHKHWEVLFKATHKIKPNISMFGIDELEPTILQLEQSFKNEQNLETVDLLIASTLDILRHVKIELEAELKSMNNEQKENCTGGR